METNEIKMYPIFCVDRCFEEYAMDDALVGAESIEDLKTKLPDLNKILGIKKLEARRIVKDSEWRIKEIPHLFTDTPYVEVHGYGYIE